MPKYTKAFICQGVSQYSLESVEKRYFLSVESQSYKSRVILWRFL